MQILIVLLGIISLVLLITKWKLDPFISILMVSLGLGLFLGQNPTTAIDSMIKGVGGLLGELSLVLGLGAMLGTLFEKSGAAETIANQLIKIVGEKGMQWAAIIAGMSISFSLFFDVAFILLIPIVITLAKRAHVNRLWLGTPAAIAILTVHVIFPPQPGPIVLINEFGLSIVTVFFGGLLVALPTIILGGIGFTKLIRQPHQVTRQPQLDMTDIFIKAAPAKITFSEALGLLLLPVILMTVPAIIKLFTTNTLIIWLCQFFSNPVIALLLTLLLAIIKLGLKQQRSMTQISASLSDSLTSIASVLMINGAAGGLKQVLTDSGLTRQITAMATQIQLSPLLAGFLIAVLLRLALGSSTVAAITAAGVVKPLLVGLSYPAELVMLSISVGSIFGSHVNDPGFWLFKQYLDIDIKTTFKTWTLATIATSCIGFLLTLTLAKIYMVTH